LIAGPANKWLAFGGRGEGPRAEKGCRGP
jgi:hypothetical protein